MLRAISGGGTGFPALRRRNSGGIAASKHELVLNIMLMVVVDNHNKLIYLRRAVWPEPGRHYCHNFMLHIRAEGRGRRLSIADAATLVQVQIPIDPELLHQAEDVSESTVF